ncbi:hypothetical protein JW835_12415, partial [bacterium]|nr:hypothetical protein [bacterium]
KKDGKDLRQRKCMDYGEKITNNKILVINDKLQKTIKFHIPMTEITNKEKCVWNLSFVIWILLDIWYL